MQQSNTSKPSKLAGLAAVALLAAMLTGCEVDTHKHGGGDDVKIATPFGGMRVKTNDAVVLEDIGLPAYPGAVAVKEDKDNSSADVNMSFGSFQLRVKAASYRTPDSPLKVETFYRDGLKRYGDVIECRDDRAVGAPTHTLEGLTCDAHTEGRVPVDDHPSKDKLELKAGSKQHQHIVAIEPETGGTKFGLVALDLPGKIFSDNGDDDTKQ
jgi:hypothetical protein